MWKATREAAKCNDMGSAEKAGSGDCLLELLCRRSHILGPGDVCLPEIARTSAVAWGNSLLAGDGGWMVKFRLEA